MKKDIVLITSIAPKNIENQQAAIASWIENGFRIVSCNVREELEIIRALFPGVEFVEVSRDARKITQKPCPYIYDMLQILKEKADDVCGIVNSDIHLRKFTEECYQFIKDNARENVVFCRRQEVENMERMEILDSQLFFGGIDTFFFPRKAIDLIEDDGLILGQAMWDYWLPIMLHKQGMTLTELINPITFHITHAVQWNDGITDQISSLICQKHFKDVKSEDATLFLKEHFFEIVTKAENICYVPEPLVDKRVLVIGNKEDRKDHEAELAQQLHTNIVYMNETHLMTDVEDFDYVIELPYRVCMSRVFVSVMLWIMDTYNHDAMQAFVYLRGNMSKVITIGNCNAELQHCFNEEIEPVAVYKTEAYKMVEKGELVRLKPCKVCVCSVWAEERAEILFPRQKIEGRILIFPAGFAAKMWVRKYQDIASSMTLKGFVDNDSSREGTTLEGLPIYSTRILEQETFYDKILVVSNLYTGQIYQQLCKMIPKERISIWKNEFDAEEWKQLRGREHDNNG